MMHAVAWFATVALRDSMPVDFHLPVAVLIGATAATSLALAMRAWPPMLHASIAPCLALIVVACLLFGHADLPGKRAAAAARDALTTALGA